MNYNGMSSKDTYNSEEQDDVTHESMPDSWKRFPSVLPPLLQTNHKNCGSHNSKLSNDPQHSACAFKSVHSPIIQNRLPAKRLFHQNKELDSSVKHSVSIQRNFSIAGPSYIKNETTNLGSKVSDTSDSLITSALQSLESEKKSPKVVYVAKSKKKIIATQSAVVSQSHRNLVPRKLGLHKYNSMKHSKLTQSLEEAAYLSGYESDSSDSLFPHSVRNIYTTINPENYAKLSLSDNLLQKNVSNFECDNNNSNDEQQSNILNIVLNKKKFLKEKEELLRLTEEIVSQKEKEAEAQFWLALREQEEALKEKEQALKEREEVLHQKFQQATQMMEESRKLLENKGMHTPKAYFESQSDRIAGFEPGIIFSNDSKQPFSKFSDIKPTFNSVSHPNKTPRTYSRVSQHKPLDKNFLPMNSSQSYNLNCSLSTACIDYCPLNRNSYEQPLFNGGSSVTITPVPKVEYNSKCQNFSYKFGNLTDSNSRRKYSEEDTLNCSTFSSESDTHNAESITFDNSSKDGECITEVHESSQEHSVPDSTECIVSRVVHESCSSQVVTTESFLSSNIESNSNINQSKQEIEDQLNLCTNSLGKFKQKNSMAIKLETPISNETVVTYFCNTPYNSNSDIEVKNLVEKEAELHTTILSSDEKQKHKCLNSLNKKELASPFVIKTYTGSKKVPDIITSSHAKVFDKTRNIEIEISSSDFSFLYQNNSHINRDGSKSLDSKEHFIPSCTSSKSTIYTMPPNQLVCCFSTGTTTSCLTENNENIYSQIESGEDLLSEDNNSLVPNSVFHIKSASEENINVRKHNLGMDENEKIKLENTNSPVINSIFNTDLVSEENIKNSEFDDCESNSSSHSEEYNENEEVKVGWEVSNGSCEDGSDKFLTSSQAGNSQDEELLSNNNLINFSCNNTVKDQSSTLSISYNAPLPVEESNDLRFNCVSVANEVVNQMSDTENDTDLLRDPNISFEETAESEQSVCIVEKNLKSIETCKKDEHELNIENVESSNEDIQKISKYSGRKRGRKRKFPPPEEPELDRDNVESTNEVIEKIPKRRGRKRGRKRKLPVSKNLGVNKLSKNVENDKTVPQKLICGVCEVECSSELNFECHISEAHNGLARPLGESQQFTEKDALRLFTMALKYVSKLICHICEKSYSSNLGFRYHISKVCGTTCSICGMKVAASLFEDHKANRCFVKESHSDDDKRTEIDRPGRRKAAVKCSKQMKVLTEEGSVSNYGESDGRSYIMFSLNDIPINLLNHWKSFIEEDNYAVCSIDACTYKFSDTEAGKEHLKECIKSPIGFMCNACLLVQANECDISRHMKEHKRTKQKIDSWIPKKKSSQAKRNLSSEGIEFMKEFEKEHFVSKLFPEFICKRSDWLPLKESDAMQYKPILKTSPPFKTISESSDWERVSLFKNSNVNSKIFFVGGPVSASAWCPTSQTDSQQFIALSTKLYSENHLLINKPLSYNGLIQIWDCGMLSKLNSPPPSLSLGIAHDFGTVMSLEWCPSGIYEKFENVSKGNNLQRLGLLVAGFSDGSVRIFSIPHPEEISTHSVIFRKKPDLSLFPSKSSMRSQCTKINWFVGKNHDYIAASYSNGMVCIWNLNNASPFLRSKDEYGSVMYPITSFLAHHGVCSSVIFCPVTNGKHIVTGGYDRTVKFWDISQTEHPLTVVRKSVVTGIVWIPYWAGGILSYDNVFGLDKTPTAFRENGYYGGISRSLCYSNARVLDISGNNWLNLICQVDEAGEVMVAFHNSLSCDTENDKNSNKRRISVCTVKLEDLHSGEILSLKDEYKLFTSSNKTNAQAGYKDHPKTFSEIMDKFGVVIYDNVSKHVKLADCDKENKEQNDIEQGPVSLYPFMAASSTSWNNNFGNHTWLFIGLQSGFGRILNLKFLESSD